MRVFHYRSMGAFCVVLNSSEAQRLCDWLEYTTNPAPNQARTVRGKLEDMLTEIVTGKEVA